MEWIIGTVLLIFECCGGDGGIPPLGFGPRWIDGNTGVKSPLPPLFQRGESMCLLFNPPLEKANTGDLFWLALAKFAPFFQRGDT